MRRSLDLVVIGAQKGGSTHLARCLGEHPQIHMVPHEVPYFQDPYFGNSDPSTLAKALQSQLLRAAIKRPDYLAAPEVPERLAAHSPKARAVAVLREPVDRLISAVYWYMQFGDLPLLGLNRTLELLLDNEVIAGYPRSGELLAGGDYGTGLRRWQKSLPRDQIDVFTTKDLARRETYDTLFGILALESFSPPSLSVRTNEGVYDSRRLAVLRRRRPFLFDWPDSGVYVPQDPKAGWRYPIAGGIRAADKLILARMFRRGQEDLESHVRDRLALRYGPQMKMVEEDFGVQLPVPG